MTRRTRVLATVVACLVVGDALTDEGKRLYLTRTRVAYPRMKGGPGRSATCRMR